MRFIMLNIHHFESHFLRPVDSKFISTNWMLFDLFNVPKKVGASGSIPTKEF